MFSERTYSRTQTHEQTHVRSRIQINMREVVNGGKNVSDVPMAPTASIAQVFTTLLPHLPQSPHFPTSHQSSCR